MAVEIIGDDSDCDLKIDESFDENDINTPGFFSSHTSIRTINCVSPNNISTQSPSSVSGNEDFASNSLHNTFKNEISNRSSTSNNIISSTSQQKIDNLPSIKTSLSDDTKIIGSHKDKVFCSDNPSLTIGTKDYSNITCDIEDNNFNSNMEIGPTNRKRKHCLEVDNKSNSIQNRHNNSDNCQSDTSETKNESTHSLNVKIHYKFNSSIFISTEINNQEMHGILMPGGTTNISLPNDKTEKGIENFDPSTSKNYILNEKTIKKENIFNNKGYRTLDDLMPSTSNTEGSFFTSSTNITDNTKEKESVMICPLDNCTYQFLNLIDVCEHLKNKHGQNKSTIKGESQNNIEPIKYSTIGTMTDMIISKNLSPNNNDVLHKPKAEKISPIIHNQSSIKINNRIENSKMDGTPSLMQGSIVDPKNIMAASMASFNFQPPGMPSLVKNNLGQSANSSTASTPIKQSDGGTKHKIHELKPNPSNVSPSTSKNSRANSTSNGINNYQMDPLRPSSVSTSLANQTGMTLGLNPFAFPPGANPFAGMTPQLGLHNQGGNANQMMNMFNPMVMQAAAAAQMRNQMFMMPNMGMQGGQMPEQIAIQMAMLGQMPQK
ncbi:Zinc finger, C2H2 domain-containing protein [Strongyloides ratti]|uniref:Zinc finger, C2H2 domain-containing protein n=1 Tax=Strongyloides ratti TaxID=34506 RepID=A0A090LK20_STRRB|nr:Zinc finger, C2H2 domain-containing protein [Strongyloides ratti]CEF68488.1 Zinc finger, C2H2 domain-containing protein [Strongyloides ratti]